MENGNEMEIVRNLQIKFETYFMMHKSIIHVTLNCHSFQIHLFHAFEEIEHFYVKKKLLMILMNLS